MRMRIFVFAMVCAALCVGLFGGVCAWAGQETVQELEANFDDDMDGLVKTPSEDYYEKEQVAKQIEGLLADIYGRNVKGVLPRKVDKFVYDASLEKKIARLEKQIEVDQLTYMDLMALKVLFEGLDGMPDVKDLGLMLELIGVSSINVQFAQRFKADPALFGAMLGRLMSSYADKVLERMTDAQNDLADAKKEAGK